jgi:hypothetical protein
MQNRNTYRVAENIIYSVQQVMSKYEKRQRPFQLGVKRQRLLSRLWCVAAGDIALIVVTLLPIGAYFHVIASSVCALLIRLLHLQT